MRSISAVFTLLLSFCLAENEVPKMRTSNAGAGAVGATELGPESFFSSDFYMTVKRGIVLHVFEGNQSKPLTAIVLDQESKSVMGSYINKTDFSVNIDWKSAVFQAKDGNLQLNGIILKMNFKKKGKEFVLTKISADQMVIGNANLRGVEMKVKSKSGYMVKAPMGYAFECQNAGTFGPDSNQNERYRIGISFPRMKLQVFNLKEPQFGPEWSCDSVFGIGLWVGILVTLFFALICFWGFSMLANIQTMDRFDDPKGKPIHVPQSD